MEKLTDEQFEAHRTMMLRKRSRGPENLQYLTDQYWNEITNQLYVFDRVDAEVKDFKSLQKIDLLTFFKVRYTKHGVMFEIRDEFYKN